MTDPQFGLDVSFYTFELPFLRFLLGFAFAATFIALALGVVVMALRARGLAASFWPAPGSTPTNGLCPV